MASWQWNSANHDYKFKVTTTQNKSSGSNNYSTISWTLQHYRGYDSYNGLMDRFLEIPNNVQTVYGHHTGTYDCTGRADNSWWTVASGTTNHIGHDSNGNKTVSIDFQWSGDSGGYGPGNNRHTWNWTLSRIALAPYGLTQSVTATGATTASVSLDISNRGHGSSAAHELQYRKHGDSTWIGTPDQSITDLAANTFSLTGLDPDTTYDYRQRVWNNYSDTAYSSAGTFKTLGYAVVNSFSQTSTDVSISANVQTDSTCDKLEYKLDGGSWTNVSTSDYTNKGFTISGLASDKTYTLQVKVRRKDSQLTTDSSVKNVTTAKQNNFMGFIN